MLYASFPTNNIVFECIRLRLVNTHTRNTHTRMCCRFDHEYKSNAIKNKLTGIILSLCQIALIDLNVNLKKDIVF